MEGGTNGLGSGSTVLMLEFTRYACATKKRLTPSPAKLAFVQMKICVLQSSYEGSTSPFKGEDSYCSPQSYSKGNHVFESVLLKKATAHQQIRELAKQNFDVFINLCDGAFDEDRAGAEVVEILEYFNLPYTGANRAFYEPSKETMKMMAHYCGVRTPSFMFAYNEEDIELAAQNLNFPLIVKHFNGYGSIGMTSKSRCENVEELRLQASKMIKAFSGALIEEFIEGGEYTVLVAENYENPSQPLAFVPIEEVFAEGSSGFKHFDLKWKDYGSIRWRASTNEKLNEELKEMSKKMFLALGGVGYGRTDIRVNKKGEPFFLEINPNCGLFYPWTEDNPDALGSADFILVNDPTMNHDKFTEHIIKCALHQHANRQKKVEVRFRPKLGYGLYAVKDIKEGEIVTANEEKPHTLVSRSQVDNAWNDPALKTWFKQNAYSVSENTYVTWSAKPTDWAPINHSCDPNTQLLGLNLVARRNISVGEQITMEYATLVTENMQEFDCLCSTSNCRKKITGTDYLLPFLEAYQGHLSDYVACKRKAIANPKP